MKPERWSPGIGDPTIGGWFTVILYFIAFVLCVRVGLQHTKRKEWITRDVAGWCSLAALMLTLCINKQLDIQSFFTQVARDMLHEYGLFDVRRYYQIRVIAGLMLITFAVAVTILITTLRARNGWTHVAGIGTAILLCYIISRAASFHKLDGILNVKFYGFNYNWLFEIPPIMMIAIAASRTRTRLKKEAKELREKYGARAIA
jgi:uncharacterized membrane protein